MSTIEWLLKHNGDFAAVVRESLAVLNTIQPNGKGNGND